MLSIPASLLWLMMVLVISRDPPCPQIPIRLLSKVQFLKDALDVPSALTPRSAPPITVFIALTVPLPHAMMPSKNASRMRLFDTVTVPSFWTTTAPAALFQDPLSVPPA